MDEVGVGLARIEGRSDRIGAALIMSPRTHSRLFPAGQLEKRVHKTASTKVRRRRADGRRATSRSPRSARLDGSTADVRVLDPNRGTWTSIATIPITIDSADTLEAIAPIKKLSWNS